MDHPSSTTLSSATAIQAALAAEARAMQAVADCRTQAEQILDAARRQASERSAQADLHISDLHKTYHKRTKKQEEKAQEENRRLRLPAAAMPSDTALQAAVSQLAAWLTGGSESPPTPPKAPTP